MKGTRLSNGTMIGDAIQFLRGCFSLVVVSVHPPAVAHDRLVLVHHRYLRRVRSVLRSLVVPHPHQAREAQRDAFARVDVPDRGLVHRRDGKVRSRNFPNHARLKPHVRGVLGDLLPLKVALGTRDDVRTEFLVKLLQLLIAEPRPDLTYRLIVLRLLVVASEEERAVDPGALALAPEGANGHEVEAVGHALYVVFLDLQPLMAAFVRFVRGPAPPLLQGFYHQPLAACGHALVEKGQNLLRVARVARRGEHEQPLPLSEGCPQSLTALAQRALDEGLSVEVQHVECEEADLDLDVGLVRIFALPGAQNLERQDPLGLSVIRHNFTVQHKSLDALIRDVGHEIDQVRVLRGVALAVPAEDPHLAILCHVDLTPLSIVLELTSEILVGKPVKHLTDALCGVSKHGFDGDTRRQKAVLWQFFDGVLEEARDNHVVAGHLAEHLL
mmetsp:Transcript_45116/g.110035  ORF Transcript_45116/g.110035 Transcript_45116/m.110035 type:complete len:442 (+) Transcript_45116:91-1416(+)